MLIIHRPEESDETITASEFRKRIRELEQHGADPDSTARERSVRAGH
jgi:hypothetical protein